LLVEEELVGRVPFEVGPDEFDGIEFRRISGEPLDVKARIIFAQLGQLRPLVNRPMVPKQNQRAPEVVQ